VLVGNERTFSKIGRPRPCAAAASARKVAATKARQNDVQGRLAAVLAKVAEFWARRCLLSNMRSLLKMRCRT
jgi:hypothetical protein